MQLLHSSRYYFVLFYITSLLQSLFEDTEISPPWVLYKYSGKGSICHGVCITQTGEVNKRRR